MATLKSQMRSSVDSNFTYPAEYNIKPIAEQIAILSELFDLDGIKALAFIQNLPDLPEGAEGCFAIPRWQSIAKTYGEALKKAVTLIAKNRKFKDYFEGKFSKEYFRQTMRTMTMFTKLQLQQESDIVIVPGQFGLRHRGKSPRFALETLAKEEFALSSFHVACMLLSHPKREKDIPGAYSQLHAYCAGDRFCYNADGQYDRIPSFFGVANILHFGGDNWMYTVCDRFGVATGFVM
ncbi:MAG: hypothetical protein PHP25_00350 [Candidatus Moranbacteria bacterium]|nr:hypothetical protein [Candidatus Moranbacteria bacterium]